MATTITQDLVAALTSKDLKVPQWNDIDPSAVQQETLQGNAATFAGAKQLAGDFNEFMRGELAKSLTAIPGFADLTGTMAKNLAAQLRGELTSSDLAATQRSGAAAMLGQGLAGSPAGEAFSARNLGLRQYQVQQNAQAQTPGYLSTMAGVTRAPMFDFSSVFLSAGQRWEMTYKNQVNRMNQEWLKNQIDAQPNKIAMAFAKQLDSDVEMAKQLAVSYYGGGTKGGGGKSSAPENPWAPGGAASNYYGIVDPVGYGGAGTGYFGVNGSGWSGSAGGSNFYGM